MAKYNHFQICELLATKHKAIQSSDINPRFFRATERMDLTELNQNISVASGTIVIAIEMGDTSFRYQNSDQLSSRPVYKMVIASQTESSDSDTIFEAIDRCNQVAHDFISRLMCFARAERHGCESIDANSFYIEAIGPIGDLFYGVMLEFSTHDLVNYSVNPDVWL